MENKLEGNPFRVNSKAYRFFERADVNLETGYSREVKRDELLSMGLGTTNGGDWCRSDGPLGKYFNINRKREGIRISSVQLCGYSKNIFDRQIPQRIRDNFQNSSCVVLYVHKIEIDHKDGRYDSYQQLSDKINDYQPLHPVVNKAKRDHCRKCRETGLRFDARNLGYKFSQTAGPEQYVGSCIGCYWYDPFVFNKLISKDFKKDK